jgi:hypothetical protein
MPRVTEEAEVILPVHFLEADMEVMAVMVDMVATVMEAAAGATEVMAGDGEVSGGG